MEILQVDKKKIKTRYLLNCFTEFSKFLLNKKFFKTANSKMLLLFFFKKNVSLRITEEVVRWCPIKKVYLLQFFCKTHKHL